MPNPRGGASGAPGRAPEKEHAVCSHFPQRALGRRQPPAGSRVGSDVLESTRPLSRPGCTPCPGPPAQGVKMIDKDHESCGNSTAGSDPGVLLEPPVGVPGSPWGGPELPADVPHRPPRCGTHGRPRRLGPTEATCTPGSAVSVFPIVTCAAVFSRRLAQGCSVLCLRGKVNHSIHKCVC